jgi:nitrile hydratase
VDSAAIDGRVAQFERAHSVSPPPAAHLVARAWRDAAFRERLLTDARAAAAEAGIPSGQPSVVLASTAREHHVVVCTLCSCGNLLTARKPTWYTSPAYRARVVREPRAVLREFGLRLPDDVAVRVHDTTAESRYLVLPRRPAGTVRYGEAQLAALVTAEALLGVAGMGRAPAGRGAAQRSQVARSAAWRGTARGPRGRRWSGVRPGSTGSRRR